MTECVFCGIVAGRAPAHRLLEDERTVAFLNIAPATVGHVLVVPRRHAEGLWDLEDEKHARVARAASRVARLLRGGAGAGRGEPRACDRGGGLADGLPLPHPCGAALPGRRAAGHVAVAPAPEAELTTLRDRILGRGR